MVYLLELDGRVYRCRDQWQALWVARVWVAFTLGDKTRDTTQRPQAPSS
jgi:hypothetical protein